MQIKHTSMMFSGCNSKLHLAVANGSGSIPTATRDTRNEESRQASLKVCPKNTFHSAPCCPTGDQIQAKITSAVCIHVNVYVFNQLYVSLCMHMYSCFMRITKRLVVMVTVATMMTQPSSYSGRMKALELSDWTARCSERFCQRPPKKLNALCRTIGR